ncbi:phospho-2-dehydro-3-deoxyheptonate aldolase [Streptomyces spiroverticillatus]|uniref:Phospho-2-dehydro-3-deoxyheptonate aldolase n=1 Tax=Streptomyces finlayi TaxID=67296 RepID=A0A919CDL3_9ACTN|nr:3-deoxy-7-phosphoheptulonate synthase [Streptomyces finlayi]GHA31760.1 phospho-2-dehydro-3-deoxyheptonate aldolase [Streptomyces spiroverticillatus]GHD10908.1 phospho-2-dehydro-3-deoxyheptonate aldolase [Streptomyces finlayi]
MSPVRTAPVAPVAPVAPASGTSADFAPLPTPDELRAQIPLSALAKKTTALARRDIARILTGKDDRKVVIVGPCSVHDPDAALGYAERLSALAAETRDQLLVVMRVYVEKPRTRVGWKGLLSDPRLDGSYDLPSGLGLARGLMAQIAGTGLPVASEFLDPLAPHYLADAVAWGAIGARTVQSQVHRQMTSGLGMPIGFKNATGGGVQDAVDAVVSASHAHVYPGLRGDGRAAVVATPGNPDGHVVLRGGSNGPNYGPEAVAEALAELAAAGLPQHLIVDVSHGNSNKDHERQPLVVSDLAHRIAAGEQGLAGVMIESFLAPGRQDLELGRTDRLVYGQSVTDACVDWPTTVRMLEELAAAVDTHRSTPTAAS